MNSLQQIEQRSLQPALWANLVMGISGVTAALMSNASALMLDGLFSAVNFSAALVASKVARSIQRKPALMRPFGYEIDEPVYIMFRSLVLIGLILMATYVACSKIFVYVTAGQAVEIKLNWIVGYMLLMVAICVALALWHHRNWLATGRRSELLRMERSAAVIDAVLSCAAGVAFLLIALLRPTPLRFLVPISDSVVVLGLATYMVWGPIGMFVKSLKEVVGEAADDAVQEKVRSVLVHAIDDDPFRLLTSAATRVGRSMFAVAYLEPVNPVTAAQLDATRDELTVRCQEALSAAMRMEFVFTARHPFDAGEETSGGTVLNQSGTPGNGD
jgi:predicted Co/Zn/Cd cation transporter (cation efflux family)